MQQRRTFKHLDSDTIKSIIELHVQQMPKLRIAEKFGIDNSTVHYHINKYERTVGDMESGDFYSIVKVGIRSECKHPSLKCSCCGKYEDNLKSEQSQKIIELQDQLRVYISRYGNLQ